MEPQGLNFFAPNEIEWLRTEWLPRFCDIDGKRLAESEGAKKRKSEGGKSQMQALIEEIRDEFARKFPHRVPAKRGAKAPQAGSGRYRISESDWAGIGQRFKNWLQKHKPREMKNKPKRQASGQPEVIMSSNVHYSPSDMDKENAKRALRALQQELEWPWSHVDEEELSKRKEALVGDLDDIIQMFARSVGVELVVFGVWEDKGSINSLELSSSRSRSFLNTVECQSARDGFTAHVLEAVGRNISVPPTPIAATVYGDSNQDDKPVLPVDIPIPLQRARLLVLYFTALWQWQGGRNDPPWTLLEDDQSSGRFALLDQNRFPPGIEKLRNPLDMDEKESEKWHQHIVRGQIGELSAADTFQFAQPRPGQFERTLRTTIHPDARLHYPPESLGYLAYLERAQALRMIQRSDELPLLDPSAIYKSLTLPTESHLRSQLANDEVGIELLDRLSRHDLAGPHHLPASSWLERSGGCPHLKSELPDDAASTSVFITELGYLHRNFFDPSSPEKLAWSLESCLKWANPEDWIHDPSKTLEGGPYGIKWPVLLLIHIRLNMMVLASISRGVQGIQWPPYYQTLRPLFSPREQSLWLLAARTMNTALEQSREQLMLSRQEQIGAQQAVEADSSGNLIVSLDDVSVFGAPSQGNEWESAGIEPQKWRPAESGTTRSTRANRRKHSGSGEGVVTKRRRSNTRKRQAAQRSSRTVEHPSALESDNPPETPTPRQTRARTRAAKVLPPQELQEGAQVDEEEEEKDAEEDEIERADAEEKDGSDDDNDNDDDDDDDDDNDEDEDEDEDHDDDDDDDDEAEDEDEDEDEEED